MERVPKGFFVDFTKEHTSGKTTENPNARRNDPEAWSCLTDEQRDIIYEWHFDQQLREAERRDEEERERRELERKHESAALFILIPFAAAYAFHHTDGSRIWYFGLLELAFHFITAYLGYCMIALPFYAAHNNSEWGFIPKAIVAVIVSLIALSLVYH